MEPNHKIKIEIWSDVMCPFCYIGKRKLEAALAAFPHANEVEVEWKSFQLDPSLQTNPGKNNLEHLSETKGWPIDYAKEMSAHVSKMAAAVGLDFDPGKTVVANSFDAHRLIQFAKTQEKGDAAEERIFRAHFTERKNTADPETLLELAKDIGLDENESKVIISGDGFSEAVRRDLAEAREFGISGVPFFLFNRKFAVSGARDKEVFVSALHKAREEK